MCPAGPGHTRPEGKLSYKPLSSCSPGLSSEPEVITDQETGEREAIIEGLPLGSLDEKENLLNLGAIFTQEGSRSQALCSPFPWVLNWCQHLPRTLSLMAGHVNAQSLYDASLICIKNYKAPNVLLAAIEIT